MRRRAEYKDVVIENLNHKINRKAMIANLVNFYCDAAQDDNYLISEQMYHKMDLCMDAFAETVKAPVGGCVRRYIGL